MQNFIDGLSIVCVNAIARANARSLDLSGSLVETRTETNASRFSITIYKRQCRFGEWLPHQLHITLQPSIDRST